MIFFLQGKRQVFYCQSAGDPNLVFGNYSKVKFVQNHSRACQTLSSCIGSVFQRLSICPSRSTVQYSRPVLYPGRLTILDSVYGFIGPRAFSWFQPMHSISRSSDCEKNMNLGMYSLLPLCQVATDWLHPSTKGSCPDTIYIQLLFVVLESHALTSLLCPFRPWGGNNFLMLIALGQCTPLVVSLNPTHAVKLVSILNFLKLFIFTEPQHTQC